MLWVNPQHVGVCLVGKDVVVVRPFVQSCGSPHIVRVETLGVTCMTYDREHKVILGKRPRTCAEGSSVLEPQTLNPKP